MKILLINPPIRTWSLPNCFPQGLGYIAQLLRNEHDVEILDINAKRYSKMAVIRELYSLDFDVVGITGLITNYAYVKWLIEEIRAIKPNITVKWRDGTKTVSEIPIVVGGVLGSSIPEIMLRKAKADICVIGEGENTAIELFNALGSNPLPDFSLTREMEGIAFLDGEELIFTEQRQPIQNINSLPLPAYDLFPTEIYAKNPVGSTINRDKWTDGKAVEVPKSMNILSSRGCPFNCFFCYHDYMGAKYRYRGAHSLFDEIVYLYENYGVTHILMGDDIFITNKKNVKEFCELMIFSGMNEAISWECGSRVDTVDREILTLCKKAGCVLVGYGVESGSQRMLDRLNKKTTVAKCHKAVEMAQDIFGEVECTFIIGTPGETRETLQETIDFCKQHNLPPHAIFYMTPYPKTPLWQWMRQEGYFGSTEHQLDEEEHLCLRLNDNEQGENLLVNFTDFTDEELISLKEGMVEELNAWNKITH